MRFQCPACHRIVAVENTDLGIEVQCGHCGQIVRVPDSRVASGAVIGDFIIRQEIGRGGMGIVYLSHQISLDRSAALKVLSAKFAGDAQFVADFIREARSAAKLNHPYIVQAYAVGEDDGIFYFAMENIDGKTVKQILAERKSIPCDQALLIIQQIAEALNYAWHEQKLIHRDIKPDNIMLTVNGRAKLADLGLAHIAGDLENTSTDEVMGTPQYISPEHLTGAPMDVRSDIYSLGATFYHMITGRFPYQGRTAAEIVHQHLDGTLIPPDRIHASIPKSVSRIILKMMQKDPRNRYQDADALIDDIRKLRQTIPGAASIINLDAPEQKIPDNTASVRLHRKKMGKSNTVHLSTVTGISRTSTLTRSQRITATAIQYATQNRASIAYRRQLLLKKKKNAFTITFLIVFGILFTAAIVGTLCYLSHKRKQEEAARISALSRPKPIQPKHLEELENICAYAKYNEQDQQGILRRCEGFISGTPPEDLSKNPEEQKKYRELIVWLKKAEKNILLRNRTILIKQHEKALARKQKDLEAERKRIEEEKQMAAEAKARRKAAEAEARRKAEQLKQLREETGKNLAEWKKQTAKDIMNACGKNTEWGKAYTSSRDVLNAYVEKLENLASENSDNDIAKKIAAAQEWAQSFLKRLENANRIREAFWNGGRLLDGTPLTVRKNYCLLKKIERGEVYVENKHLGSVFTVKISKLSKKDREKLLEKALTRTGLNSDFWLYCLLSGNLGKAKESAQNDKDFLLLEDAAKE